MGLFLAELARAVPAGTHAVLVLDRAGWHVSGDLVVPANLTLVHLPPYSPELNPVERVWLYLREQWLSHRVLAGGYGAVVDAAWQPGTRSPPSPAASARSPPSRGCPLRSPFHEIGITGCPSKGLPQGGQHLVGALLAELLGELAPYRLCQLAQLHHLLVGEGGDLHSLALELLECLGAVGANDLALDGRGFLGRLGDQLLLIRREFVPELLAHQQGPDAVDVVGDDHVVLHLVELGR